MTKLMLEAIDSLRRVPDDQQDEIARLVLRLARDNEPNHKLTAEEQADLDEADAEIDRGELATDEEVRALWAKHGL